MIQSKRSSLWQEDVSEAIKRGIRAEEAAQAHAEEDAGAELLADANRVYVMGRAALKGGIPIHETAPYIDEEARRLLAGYVASLVNTDIPIRWHNRMSQSSTLFNDLSGWRVQGWKLPSLGEYKYFSQGDVLTGHTEVLLGVNYTMYSVQANHPPEKIDTRRVRVSVRERLVNGRIEWTEPDPATYK